jgi:hypothetical protein
LGACVWGEWGGAVDGGDQRCGAQQRCHFDGYEYDDGRAGDAVKANQVMEEKDRLTINRTPNPACPGCLEFRLHSEEEFEAFHPWAGHGYYKGQGWSHPDLEPKK